MRDAFLSRQVEQGRPASGVVEHFGGSLEQDGEENVPGLHQVQNQQRQDAGSDNEVAGVDAGQDAPAVQPVGQHTGDQGERRPGAVEEDRNQSDLEGRVGEVVDEVAQHNEFHAPGNLVNPPGRPQQLKVPVPEDFQRRNVAHLEQLGCLPTVL